MNKSFREYSLNEDILKSLDLLKFKSPTKVQEQVLPVALQAKDIVVKSQTGSGKTGAFAIPICELVDWEENKPQALVLTPTRELAMKVKKDFFNIGRFKRIKVAALYGKSAFWKQEKELKQKTHVVVGTPGRVFDHLQRGTFVTDEIRYLVLDEADEMLNMGFIEQVEEIMSKLPKGRVTMLFSATFPKDIEKLCERYLKDPTRIEIAAENLTADKVEQVRYKIEEKNKMKLLQDITVVENPDSCIIFCNTKVKVDEVCEELVKQGYACDKIHGGMEQDERLKVMESFKKGYFRYLIATDVAARGIDIHEITHVINYDIPQDKESYVHRIGRTGRASKSGKAISLVAPQDEYFLKEVHKYIGKEILLVDQPMEDEVNSCREAFREKMEERPEIKESKGEKLNQEILKLHINAGKKTKMRPVDIVGTICNIEGMTAADIGIINILDVSTFVEILNNKGEMVLRELQNKPIKGRMRRVSKAGE